MIGRFGREERGVSAVIGVVLLVAITVLLSSVIAIYGLGVTDKITGQPSPTAATVSISETNAGSEITVERVEKPVEIQLNGQTLYEVDQSDVGATYFVPTAPGDRVTVVATGESQQLVLNKQLDEHNAGDFIAYYEFDTSDSPDRLVDESGNGNDATVYNDPDWVEDSHGTGIQFDADNKTHAEVTSLAVDETKDVEEMTVVIKYRTTDDAAGTGTDCGNCDEIQQLIEHHTEEDASEDNFEWYLETVDNTDSEYEVNYVVRPESVQTSNNLQEDDVHVLIGTYDGEQMRYYLDGELVATRSLDRQVNMGDVSIAADAPDEDIQFLNGRIYEVRLYYTAMDDSEAEIVTTAVNSTAN